MSRASRVGSSVLWCLAVIASMSRSAAQVHPADTHQQLVLTHISQSIPADGAMNVPLDRPTFIIFSRRLDPATVNNNSISVRGGSPPVAFNVQAATNRRVVTITYPGFLPGNQRIFVTINGDLLRDENGLQVDADNDKNPGGVTSIEFQDNPAVDPPVVTDAATITGYVFDVSGAPLPGAVITSIYFPGVDGASPLPVPPGISDAQGHFEYHTVPITGSNSFLVHIDKTDYSQSLREATVMAGGTLRVANAFLQPLSPPVMVMAGAGGMVQDTTHQVTLNIPPGALQGDSNLRVTMLHSAGALRDALPQFVSAAGTFVDITGAAADDTNSLMTMRVPNIYNLPLNTRVPFGKIDHHTLIWSDLRDLYHGPPPMPDTLLGRVVSDPANGTAIEVSFDHFCSVCTGYCLPYPTPTPTNGTPADQGQPSPQQGGSCPGTQCGNSTISFREGFLWETLSLPGFREFGDDWSLTLGYASHAASPSVTLTTQVNYNSTRPVERTLFEFEIEGATAAANYVLSSNNQRPIGTWFWNGANSLGSLVPTGSYPYKIVVTSLNANTALSLSAGFGSQDNLVTYSGLTYPGLTTMRAPDVTGRAVVINRVTSSYGAGWCVLGEDRLHFDADGCVLLAMGNSDWRRFVRNTSIANTYTSPSGEFSELLLNPQNGSWERRFNDGATHHFDSTGRIATKIDRYGNTTTFGYTGGLLASLTSPTGFSYSFSYVGGKLSAITDSAGRTTQFSVNGVGDLVSTTDVTNSTRAFQYDSGHRLTAQVGPRGERSEYAYSNDRVTEISAYDVNSGPLLRRRRFAPSALKGEVGTALALGQGTLGNPIPLVTDAVDVYIDGNNNTSTHESDSRGRTIRRIDGLGQITQYTYDAYGLLDSQIHSNGWITEFDWNDHGSLSTMREKSAPATLYSTTLFEYGGIFEQISRAIDAENKETRFFYDALGNLTAVRDQDGNQSNFAYQNSALPHALTSSAEPTGNTLTFTYDAHGNLATATDYPDPINYPSGRLTGFSQDTVGRTIAITNPLGKTSRIAYDALNRPMGVTDPLLITHLFDYTDQSCGCATSRLTKATFPNGTSIQYRYDGLDRLVQRTDQLGNSTTWSYDGEGHLSQSVDRNGQILSRTYDAAGQLTQIALPGGETITSAYDSIGDLLATSWPGGSLTFTRDFLGRDLTERQDLHLDLPGGSHQTTSHTLTRTWDRVGNRTSLQDDSGKIRFDYGHDNEHRLISISSPVIAGLSWSLVYDAAGRVIARVPSANGGATTIQYDLAGQVESILHQTTPGTAEMYTGYDATGNLTKSIRQLGTSIITTDYGYDDNSRLASATTSVSVGESQLTPTYTYDIANKLQNDGEWIRSYDNEGRLIRRVSATGSLDELSTYDALGRLRGFEQRWISLGVPSTVLRAFYDYDTLGRRVTKRVNGVEVRYLFDGRSIVAKYDGFDRLDRLVLVGTAVDDLLSIFDVPSGTVTHCRTDLLGSVIGASNASGSLIDAGYYLEFGQEAFGAPVNGAEPFGYVGREWDVDAESLYLRARNYDYLDGVFDSEDPLDLAGGLGLYSYARNNPLRFTDPLGMGPQAAAQDYCGSQSNSDYCQYKAKCLADAEALRERTVIAANVFEELDDKAEVFVWGTRLPERFATIYSQVTRGIGSAASFSLGKFIGGLVQALGQAVTPQYQDACEFRARATH